MFNKHTIELPQEFMTDTIDPIAVLAQETEQWNDLAEEGQLAIDVLQTTDSLIIITAMAGTKPEHINLHLQDDLLTIRGVRESPLIDILAEPFYQECFWGRFSRTIILPVAVLAESAEAEFKNGVLTIRLKKATTDNTIPIMVIEE
jgi:HSP20 family protein